MACRIAFILPWVAILSLRSGAGGPEMIPSNVPVGFLPPLSVWTNLVQKASLSFQPVSEAGSFVLQNSETVSPPAWKDIHAEERAPGVFEVDAPPAFRLYRLKSSDGGPVSLELAQVVRRTNQVIDFPFLAGWEHCLQAQDANDGPWRTVPSYIVTNGTLTVEAKGAQRLRILAKPPVQREEYEAIFVGGQSNAELGDNWYYPDKLTNVVYIDEEIRFRNPGLFEEKRKDWPWGYSFAVGAASLLSEGIGKRYLLVPVAVGGTTMAQWMPGADRFDRSTLFGRANFMRVAAAPQPIRAIWYYGHESSSVPPHITTYIPQWKALMAEFQKEIGAVPILFAQLSKSTDFWQHSNMFVAAEQQRLSEDGQAQGTTGHHMVVTFDLPLGDGLHLSGEANRLLGIRFARAMRQHVYGEAVDGTGPRLVSVTRPASDPRLFRVTFTQAISEPVNAYDHQFRITDGEGPIVITEYDRTADGFAVELRVARNPSGAARVSYGEPVAAGNFQYLTNVVRNAEGLPAPCFGPQVVK